MTADEKESLVRNTLTILQREKGDEGFNYYGELYNECQKYGLTETAFRKSVLPHAFQRFERVEKDPEEIVLNRNRFVTLFGKDCFNTLQIARELYNHPHQAKEYLEDVTLLKHDVTMMSGDSNLGLEVGRIFKSESNPVNRYVKLIYFLHPKLPFRIDTNQVQTIDEMVVNCFRSYSYFRQVAHEFQHGRLQIWLNYSDPISASRLTDRKSFDDFLTFIYQTQKNLPFYVGEELFLLPEDISKKAGNNLDFWSAIYENLECGEIWIWIQSLGFESWENEYKIVSGNIDTLDYLGQEDREKAKVQAFLEIVDKAVPEPTLVPEISKVELLSISSQTEFDLKIKIRLSERGFVKARVSIDNQDGLYLRTNDMLFHHVTGALTDEIILKVRPDEMIRNKSYTSDLRIQTAYQTISIPIELKVVFPMKEFLIENLKFAGMFAGFFGLVRALLAIQFPDWLNNTFPTFFEFDIFYWNPAGFYLFGFLLILFILGLVGSSIFILKRFLRYG